MYRKPYDARGTVGEGDKVRSFQQTRLSWEHGGSLRWKSRYADLVNWTEERRFLNLSGMDRDPSNVEARVFRDIDKSSSAALNLGFT